MEAEVQMTNKLPHLTKSKYLSGLRCVRKLWLDVHDHGPYVDPASGSAMDIGNRVGRGAHTLFPGGVEIDARPWAPSTRDRGAGKRPPSSRLNRATTPPQSGTCRIDGGADGSQRPASEFLAPHSKATALSVGQSRPSTAELLAEDPILLPEIVDQIFLMPVQPASEGQDEELKRVGHHPRLRLLDSPSPGLPRRFQQPRPSSCTIRGAPCVSCLRRSSFSIAAPT